MPHVLVELPVDWRFTPRGVQMFVEKAMLNLSMVHNVIIESHVNQMFYANQCRWEEHPFREGELVYLSTENLNLPQGQVRKLMPKFIGPYPILVSRLELSTYELDLPDLLKSRRIHSTFHVSQWWQHEPNNDILFPHHEVKVFYDFGVDPNEEWLINTIIGHRWNGHHLKCEV